MFPLQFLLITLCGRLRQEQDNIIAFLREENRVLKAHIEQDASAYKVTASIGVAGTDAVGTDVDALTRQEGVPSIGSGGERLTAIWYLAATPFLWTLLFWSFVLRARFSLGHWPAPYQPDPKDLGFVVHYYLLLAGMPLALAAAVVVPAVVLFSYRTLSRSPARPGWAAALAAAGGAGLVLWGQLDPGQFLTWLGD